MILPGSYLFSLILLAVGLLLMGSWANTFKMAGPKWRWELYYFDLAAGAFLLMLIAALTIGTIGFDGFSFSDDVRLAGKRQDFYGFMAGGLFNLGNMLVVGGMSLTAMSIALPIGLSVGLAVSSLADLAINRQSTVLFTLPGALALLAAAVVLALAWREFAMARLLELARQGKTKSTRRSVDTKGVVLCVFGGIFIGASQPLLNMARVEDVGLGPYSLGFVFACGMLVGTFVLNLFFMNLPIAGEPIDIVLLFRAKATQHLPGLLGGFLLGGAILAGLVVTRAEGAGQVAQRIALPITQSAMVLAMLFGLIIWKDLTGYEAKVKSFLGLALLLMIAGIGLTALGIPLPAAR